FTHASRALPRLHSFPTRRSSDLEATEAEVEPSALQARALQADRPRVAALGEPLDRRPARVAETQELRDLVERLADGVVARPAKAAIIPCAAREIEARVATGDDQAEEGKRDRVVGRPVEVGGE